MNTKLVSLLLVAGLAVFVPKGMYMQYSGPVFLQNVGLFEEKSQVEKPVTAALPEVKNFTDNIHQDAGKAEFYSYM